MATTVTIGASNVNAVGTTLITTSAALSGANWSGTAPAWTPSPKSNPNSIQNLTTVQTVNGTTTVAIPTGAAGVIIMPPTNGTVALSIKTTVGDTGIPISKFAPSDICFDTAPAANLYLVCNGVELVQLAFY